MPVTAKLSKHFYDALGEDVVNEMVEWFSSVDATYRADLRELIEAQAQRFDARLEQRLSEVKTELRSEMAGLRAEMSAMRSEMATRADLANLRAELLKWLFLFWVGTMGTVLAILKL
jgi:hypothetical protein